MGQLMIAARSLFREVKNTLPDDKHLGQFVRLQIAFAHCLRMTLRREKGKGNWRAIWRRRIYATSWPPIPRRTVFC